MGEARAAPVEGDLARAPRVAVTERFAGMVVATTSPESPPAAVAFTARTWKV